MCYVFHFNKRFDNTYVCLIVEVLQLNVSNKVLSMYILLLYVRSFNEGMHITRCRSSSILN